MFLEVGYAEKTMYINICWYVVCNAGVLACVHMRLF
jgi:hypothetical protein